MKIFILDNDKITKFNLPHEIQGSFLIPYRTTSSKKECNINIEARDGKWVLKSNGLVNVIQNGSLVLDTVLKEYSYQELEILSIDRNTRILYCLPQVESNLISVSMFNVSSITIGSGNCNICYRSDFINSEHIVIQNNNGTVILKAIGPGVYVNGLNVMQAVLKTGDVIFLYGLKIIYMGDFIKFNNPMNAIITNGLQYYNDLSSTDYTNYEKINIDDNDIELYDEGSYFYHIPRIKEYVTEEEIKIDSPPEEDKVEKTPIFLTIGSSITMAASSFMMGFSVIIGLQSGNRSFVSLLPQIIMCVALVIGSLIMPRITNAYNNKQKKKKENLRQEKYGKYLEEKRNEINRILDKQTSILKTNYPSQTECTNFILNNNKRLWERQIFDSDFLDISVGNGERKAKIKISAQEKKFSLEEDDLEERVFELVKKSKNLIDVPITLSLTKNRFSAIICNTTVKKNYVDNIILQLLTLQGAQDLKLVFFLEQKEMYEYAKNLPHVWSEDKSNRYYASNIANIKIISELLEKKFKERKENIKKNAQNSGDNNSAYKNFSPYYLIITDCYKKIKDVPIINEVLKSETNTGFSIMFIEDNLVDLPPQCQTFTYVLENNSYVIEPIDDQSITTQFNLPNIQNINMDLISSKLSNIPIPIKSSESVLPESLTFLEMYGVSKIEQLNILNRWEQNNPVNNLKTPIGVHADRDLFILDLHEKAHGPHGLIAGSTGSGKSEFIITFVLSMAINFHPNEVQFVLIDYKGGGLAGAFENREKGICLPHLAGTITNLDTAEMNRSLVSINSELKRRQKKFNQERDRLGEGTIDIYKYQKLYREGKIKEPIAHLFIISDEFAELKAQQPEFMNELISISRIGRSLGVHLILATQKPSGVVNDQIWANSKFKICLKVQDRGDSMEMLKRPEAASIKQTGRFYLQVGYDEYFDIGQSGYSGAKYIPSDRIVRKVDSSIEYINEIGEVIKVIDDNQDAIKKNDVNLGDQLTNIVKYIVNVSKQQKISINKLWLSSIPAVIYLDGMIEKYSYNSKPFLINPAIGEYDDPASQNQGLLTIDLSNIGHLLVYGMAGSGKENLLTTLIYSTCINHSPDEVNFYIFDFGAETLRIFSKYPHVGVVATVDENDLILNTLLMIDEEATKRKNLFTDYAGNYKNYIKESGSTLPLIVVVINSYEIFVETNARLAEALNQLIRDGSKYGIVFIITTSVNNSLGARMQQLFLNKISLQQPDENVYRSVLNSPKGLYPKKMFGRGIALYNEHFYEFQTAYVAQRDEMNKTLKETGISLNQKYKRTARKIAVLPDTVTFDMIKDKVNNINNVPVGFSKNEKDVFLYDFGINSVTPILSKNISDKINFIKSICMEMKNLENTNITVIDALNLWNDYLNDVTVYNNNFDTVLVSVIKEINKEQDSTMRVFILIGFSKFREQISEQYIQYFNSLMDNITKFKKSKLLIFDNYDSFKNLQIENWYQDVFSQEYGIWLGEGANEQILLNFDKLSMQELNDQFSYIGFVTQGTTDTIIKYVIDEEGD